MSLKKEALARAKEELLVALEKCLGNVSDACKSLGVNRRNHYNYMGSDKAYKETVLSIQDMSKDFVESKLFELIDGVHTQYDNKRVYKTKPDTTAIIFYLKTRAKDRGYSEKQIIETTNRNENIELTQDQINKIVDSL